MIIKNVQGRGMSYRCPYAALSISPFILCRCHFITIPSEECEDWPCQLREDRFVFRADAILTFSSLSSSALLQDSKTCYRFLLLCIWKPSLSCLSYSSLRAKWSKISTCSFKFFSHSLDHRLLADCRIRAYLLRLHVRILPIHILFIVHLIMLFWISWCFIQMLSASISLSQISLLLLMRGLQGRNRLWRWLLIFHYLFSKDDTAISRDSFHKRLKIEVSLADGLQDDAAPLIFMVLRSNSAL